MRAKRIGSVLAGMVAAAIGAGIAITLLPSMQPRAPEQPLPVDGMVWVANEGSDSLTGIDVASARVVARVDGIPAPHNVQAGPDDRTYAVASDGTVRSISAGQLELLAAAQTGQDPAHVVASRDGDRVYVSASGDDSVSVHDERLRRIGRIDVGDFPHGMRLSPDGRWLLVANMEDGTLSLVDTATDRVERTIEVGPTPVQTAFHPDGRWAYVTLNEPSEVVRLDTRTWEVVERARVDRGPVQSYPTPDGRSLIVASQGTKQRPSRRLSVLDARTLELTASIETGSGPHGVVVEPGSRFAFVTNLYDGTVAFVDLQRELVVRRVRTGAEPNGITYMAHRHDRDMPDRMRLERSASGDDHAHGH